ncbi:MAG: DUF2752 domain-containing protein [Victivallales bacterium]|nr:DUF2752 domain-containing protein [Victivallales bacterium]
MKEWQIKVITLIVLFYSILTLANLFFLRKFELCPCRMFLGIPCPGCGLTHSVIALLHGDVLGSIVYHPFTLPLIATLVAGLSCHFRLQLSCHPIWLSKVISFFAKNRRWHGTLFFGISLYYFIRFIVFFPNGPYPMEYCHTNYMEFSFFFVKRLIGF